jgi:tRNA modification GTPase
LLNQLLGEERAIVSNIAGTTRDVIEETLNIDGILFRLIDTAGIREDAEAIEALGIERSHEKIKQAQLVLIMSDYSQTASDSEGHQSMNELEATEWSNRLAEQFPDKHFLVVGNKADLRATKDIPNSGLTSTSFLPISAKTGAGMNELKKWLVDQVMGDFNTQTDTIVTNARHLDALHKTAESLEKAKWGLDTNVTGDFVAMDIRQAMFELGTITGDISTEDLLGNIFSKFCIGK